MVSFSKLNRNIEIVRKYIKILDDFKIDSVEELENNMKDYLAISMSCFTILNAVIEIGEGLIDLKDIERVLVNNDVDNYVKLINSY